ncbi:DoxX family membrane protein [Chryseolinea sp. T2]|uniref:DoxX family membrane protein n=1 Tax=Chryseolinea sp. T2 TaxID=3129255 RepID=UPI0030789CF0
MPALSVFTRLFASAIAGIGVLQWIFLQVLAGRPAAIVTNPNVIAALAIVTGLALVACAVQLWRESINRILLISTSVFVFTYSGLSNLFFVVSQADYGGVLTSFGKAITIGSALLLYADLIEKGSPSWSFNLSRVCLGVFLTIGGVQHFLFADFVKFLVPSWIPFNVFWTYFAGVALIGSGLSLLINFRIRIIAQLAGWMVFTWFLVLHIPRGIADPHANELTAVCESLAVSAILFTLSRIKQSH